MNPEALLVLSTCPDRDTAERIARALVERRLAACINILPGITSVYRWRDAVEAEPELLMLIKTDAAAYPALEAELRRLHPYELPEIIAVSLARGLPDYLSWVHTEVVVPK